MKLKLSSRYPEACGKCYKECVGGFCASFAQLQDWELQDYAEEVNA